MKAHGYKTEVMGASFRNKHQCIELAGCDLLTISPQLLKDLSETTDVTVRLVLDKEQAKVRNKVEKIVHTEESFRWALNEDEMATIKTAEGIRLFSKDLEKLEVEIQKLL